MTNINPLNDGQQRAVTTRGCSILVSAPAGSGKTKILVSRILSLLEKDHYHVDQLLVLTFTNAAALEMKQRLEQDLEKRLQEVKDPLVKRHLEQQKQKLPTAYITNFHGFCSTLLKQYGYVIGIPSSFEIISNPLLLQHQILDTCIEDWIQNPSFQTFITTQYNTYHFQGFKSQLLKLYTFSHTLSNFETYTQDLQKNIYQPIIQQQAIDCWPMAHYIKDELKNKAIEGRNNVIALRNFCQQHGLTFFYQNPYETGKSKTLPSPYDCYILYFYTILQDLETLSLTELIKKGSPTLETSYRASFDDDTRVYQKEYNAKRAMITKGYIARWDSLVYTDTEESSRVMEVSLQTLTTLFSYVAQFEKAYQEYKKEHTILDFNDLEKYAHLLLEPQYHVVDTLYHQLQEIMIDEYQDTNQIQETLMQKIAGYQQPEIPCFMVGDMKQSIYKFRGGDPAIFHHKYTTFSTDTSPSTTKRIDLQFNYRSNKIVLDSVNYLCNQIMDMDIGGLEYYYDESAKLNYDYVRKEGARSLEEATEVTKRAKERLDTETRFTTELLFIEKNKDTAITTAEKEAMVVAKKIQSLVGNFILDDYTKKTRVTEYKDIVVLMRNTTAFITFKKVFDRYQIPNQIVLSQGFLQSQEIINSIYVLKAIDNHLDDIAMVSLLKGMYSISHFEEDFLVAIREDPTISMYDNLQLYVSEQKEQYQRVEAFLEYYEALVQYSKTHTVKETLATFYQDSEYPIFVSALINGKQRYANMELLLEQLTMETAPLHTVVQKYSDMLESAINMSPGQVVSTNNNTVSFMTIHKSKGLEFPIVFISQLHKQFNKQDSREQMIMDKELGIAIKPRSKQDIAPYHDVIVEHENKYRNIIACRQTKELIDEEMRIFYVALTRASQKLIMTGAMDSFSTILTWQEKIMNNEDADMIHSHPQDTVLLYRNIRNVSSYLDWLGVSIIRHPMILQQCKEKQFASQVEDDILIQLQQNANTIAIYKNPNNHFSNTEHAKFHLSLLTDDMLATTSYVKENKNTIMDMTTYETYANFSYPKENTLEKSIAVTKKIRDGDRTFTNVHYDREEDSTVLAKDRGTIIHNVLEHLPLVKHMVLDDALSLLYEKFHYSLEHKEMVENYKEHLQNFIQSPIYQQLLQGDVVYREKKFTWKEENGQIVHGIFDALIVQTDTITVLDYKTDRVAKNTTKEKLIALHKAQMTYYKDILKRRFPTHHICAIVYYLYIDTYVEV